MCRESTCPCRCLDGWMCGGGWRERTLNRSVCCGRGVRDWGGETLHLHSMYPGLREEEVGLDMSQD